MKNTTKLLALLLACLMVVPFLFACGGDPDESEKDNVPGGNEGNNESDDDESKTVHDLPDLTWDGATFNVLGNASATYPQFQNFEIVYDEENLGEGVNDAIFKRNSKIESQYDVKITQFLAGSISASLSEDSISGDKLYDLAFQTLNEIGTNALEGYFFDMNRMKYIDFTKPYWNLHVNEVVSIADRVYFTSSDFALRDKNRAYVLFYNPELAESHGIPDLVPLVRADKWTVDLMTEYADIVDADITGEGNRSVYDDVYGLVADSATGFAAFIYSTNNMIVGRDENNDLSLIINNEHTISSIDKIIKLFCNKNITSFATGADWDSSSVCWYAGRSLFSAAFTHSLKTSTENCEFDFGIIPFPKYDEDQDNYYTMADRNCMLFAIPTSCKDPEFSSFMIELLSAESTDTSLYAYYDVACKTRYSYNPENGEMLDLIFKGIRYDSAVIYSIGGLYDIFNSIIPTSGQNIFSNQYKRKENNALNKLATIKDTLGSLEY